MHLLNIDKIFIYYNAYALPSWEPYGEKRKLYLYLHKKEAKTNNMSDFHTRCSTHWTSLYILPQPTATRENAQIVPIFRKK